jgi:hypothetical protein
VKSSFVPNSSFGKGALQENPTKRQGADQAIPFFPPQDTRSFQRRAFAQFETFLKALRRDLKHDALAAFM